MNRAFTRRATLALCVVLWLAGSTTQLGCGSLVNTGPTPVSQAELYQPGVPDYDKFFARFHALQLVAAKAPTEHWTLQKSLAAEIGLDAQASMELVGKQLDTRLADLQKHGSTLRIELIGLEEGARETDAIVSLTDSTGRSVDSSLAETLQQTAKRGVKLAVQLRAAKKNAAELSGQLSELEANVDAQFRLRGPLRAKEARRNLTDARALLPTLQRAIELAEEDNQKLIELLTGLSQSKAKP